MTDPIRAIARRIIPYWPFWAGGTSALMLAAAHYFEKVEHLAPCTLCLKQREVYWTALTVSAIAVAVRFTPLRARLERPLNALLGVAFLVGMGIAIWHTGAEWKWWPGPPTCASTGANTVDMSALSAALSGETKIKPPACDQAVWWFLGLSMAGWNVLISAKLAAWSFVAAFWRAKDVR